MTPRSAPRPAPIARIRLDRVPVRGDVAARNLPVFHVFEELFRRSARISASAPGLARPAAV